MICDAWTVVVVPFPFTDSGQTKMRPAVVLSNRLFNREGQTILAMITSARHQPRVGDMAVAAGTANLPKDSLIRMKVFTLDSRLIERKVGTLPAKLGELLEERVGTILRRR